MKKLILIALIFAGCEQDKFVNKKGVYSIKKTCLEGYYTTDPDIVLIGDVFYPTTSNTWHCTKHRIDTTYIKLN